MTNRVFFSLGFRKPEEVDSRYILPVFDVLFPFLPEKILSKLRFGVRYQNETNADKDEKIQSPPPYETMESITFDPPKQQHKVFHQMHINAAFSHNNENKHEEDTEDIWIKRTKL